jgi:GNAT superfamily N-acetyltransferase
MQSSFFISTDKSKLDIELIHGFLSIEAYWAKGRSIDTVKKSIENSLCFGVYDSDYNQVGFARVVTDYSVFAWIMDVFILDDYRGKGLSKELMNVIMKHSDLQSLQRWGLGTHDAHGLYEKHGFRIIQRPEIFMEKIARPS